MAAARDSRPEKAPGELPSAFVRRSAAAEFQRQGRQLKSQMAELIKSGRELHRALAPTVSDDEIEAMRTPTANLLGTLECLIAEDLKSVNKKLDELAALLERAMLVSA